MPFSAAFFCLCCAGLTKQAQPVSVESLVNQRLRPGFVLVFDVVREDLTTRRMRQDVYDQVATRFADRVKSGMLSKDWATHLLNGIKSGISAPRPPDRFTLTMSANESTLLIEEVRPTERWVRFVRDGRLLSYRVDLNQGEMAGSLFESEHDLNLEDHNLPLLGCSLPHFEMFGNASRNQPDGSDKPELACLVIRKGSRNGKNAAYAPSRLTATNVDGRPRLSRIVCPIKGQTWDTWEFADQSLFQDLWLPHRIQYTSYRPLGREGDGKRAPDERITWVLKQADPTPLSSARYLVDSCLKKGSYVQLTGASFSFNPALGDFEHQYQMVLQGQDIVAEQRKLTEKLEAEHPIPPSGKPASAILTASSAEAKRTGKRQIVVFTASWCGSCHQLHRVLSSPSIRSIVESHFVVVYVDVLEPRERRNLENAGGAALMDSLVKRVGLPAVVFLDANGKKLDDACDLIAEQEPKEKKDLLLKFRQNAPAMTDAEFSRLKASFDGVKL